MGEGLGAVVADAGGESEVIGPAGPFPSVPLPEDAVGGQADDGIGVTWDGEFADSDPVGAGGELAFGGVRGDGVWREIVGGRGEWAEERAGCGDDVTFTVIEVGGAPVVAAQGAGGFQVAHGAIGLDAVVEDPCAVDLSEGEVREDREWGDWGCVADIDWFGGGDVRLGCGAEPVGEGGGEPFLDMAGGSDGEDLATGCGEGLQAGLGSDADGGFGGHDRAFAGFDHDRTPDPEGAIGLEGGEVAIGSRDGFPGARGFDFLRGDSKFDLCSLRFWNGNAGFEGSVENGECPEGAIRFDRVESLPVAGDRGPVGIGVEFGGVLGAADLDDVGIAALEMGFPPTPEGAIGREDCAEDSTGLCLHESGLDIGFCGEGRERGRDGLEAFPGPIDDQCWQDDGEEGEQRDGGDVVAAVFRSELESSMVESAEEREHGPAEDEHDHEHERFDVAASVDFGLENEHEFTDDHAGG
ncbi:MAG: hypothetical protein RI897_3847 [Verrucomicrobiota bacterium]